MPVVLVLGLLALGEGSFALATDEKTAQKISVQHPGGARDATLMALGASAMIYQVDGSFYLAGPRGENPMKVHSRPTGLPGRSPTKS